MLATLLPLRRAVSEALLTKKAVAFATETASRAQGQHLLNGAPLVGCPPALTTPTPDHPCASLLLFVPASAATVGPSKLAPRPGQC